MKCIEYSSEIPSLKEQSRVNFRDHFCLSVKEKKMNAVNIEGNIGITAVTIAKEIGEKR